MLITKVPLSSETLKTRLLHWAATSSSYPFFKGSSKDLTSWFAIVERACEENEIVDVQYSEAAIVFIQGDLAHVMEERQLRYLEKSGNPYWTWEEFKDDIRRVILEAEKSKLDHPTLVASFSIVANGLECSYGRQTRNAARQNESCF